MADNNDKIDLIRALHFIWKNKRIYIISMITCISLSLIYCVYIIPDIYESTAVLYYPERAGGEIESVSERDLMDDAVEILRQKRMLAIAEDKTGIDWETISEGLSITANAETGIIDISFRMDSAESSYECTKALLTVIDNELAEIIPIGDLILLEDPELPEKPLINGWKTELAAGIAAGGVFGSVIAVYLRKVKKKESIN